MKESLRKFVKEIRGDFQVNKVYEARWVWYHTIIAVELLLIIILLAGILIKL